jgi:hypothetical protein
MLPVPCKRRPDLIPYHDSKKLELTSRQGCIGASRQKSKKFGESVWGRGY